MFKIEMRKLTGALWGNWFGVYESQDGGAAADYLRALATENRAGVEYRMIYTIANEG